MGGESPIGRIERVDALRGYALMGLFLVHMVEYYELYWASPKPSPIFDAIFILFAGKTFSLLALCFGFSFWVVMEGAARKGTDFSLRFAWRLLLLAGIGWLHSLVYRGDIIVTLALAGFLLIPLNRIRSTAVLTVIAGFMFLQPILIVQLLAALDGAAWALAPPNFFTDPTMPVYLTGSFGEVLSANLWAGQAPKFWYYFETGRASQIVGLYITGLLLGRAGCFADPDRFRRSRLVALLIAAASVAAIWAGRDAIAGALGLAAETPQRRVLDFLLASYQGLAATALSVLLFLQVWQSRAVGVLKPLAPFGRMTLTFYVGQSLVFVPVFYGFGLALYRELGSAEALGLGLVAVVAQLVMARLWLARFAYGPLEWVWRALTWLSRDVPFRRKAAAT